MQSSGDSTTAIMKALLRLIEPAWCAIFIIVPAIWYIILSARLINTPTMVNDDWARALGRVTPYLIVTLGIEIYYGVALARFILRLIPSQLSGTDQNRLGWRLLVFGGCMSPLLLLFSVLIPSAQIALTISFALWLPCVLIPLYFANRKLKALSPGRFIVFLRRFSTFADRAVIGLVLSQAPRYKPVVFLTPNRSHPGDWNPFLIGFAGLKFRAPVNSMPVILRAPDSDWETAAESLIDNADLIVFDISEDSRAIQTEITMIERASRWHDAICIKDGATTGNPAFDELVLAKGGWLISYKTNWAQILPRLVLFLVVSVVALLYLVSIVTQHSRPVSDIEKGLATLTAVILWVVPFLSGVGLLVYSTLIFPSITLSAKPAVRRALRKVPSDERLIRNLQQHQEEFERLVSMSLEDVTNDASPSLCVITAAGNSDKELTISSKRRDQYRELFQAVGLHYGTRIQSTDSILLPADNNIVGRRSCEKGYVYTLKDLSPLYGSLDVQSARGRYLFRKLNSNWYLYLYEK